MIFYLFYDIFIGNICIIRETYILSGVEIMKILNLDPGPKVGKLLEELREAQAAGEISTREQAVAYARHLLNKMK